MYQICQKIISESEFATIHPRFPLAAEGVFVKEIPTWTPEKQQNICKDNRYMFIKTTLMPNIYIARSKVLQS